MALVRVYCGLASANPPQQLAVGSPSLSATVVDDAGRLLDVCDIGDDPYGYAYLSTLLAERASGPYSVAIAADSDQRLVPALLTAAGWALAYVDGDATDDFAERFADELSEEVESAPIQRRALGLARALHAGALSATLLPAPAELSGLKPVLAAHGALSTGRHAAAVALREVLRELYPAALRAYPDPADPVALAVMDALPEPGALASSIAGRGRDAAATADAVTAQLAADGVADQAAISEAITALRVAIAETPRRGGVNKGLTATVAETVRQSVAAVRACDAACTVLVRALAERVTGPVSGVASSNSSPATARASVPRHQAPTHQPSAHQPSAHQTSAHQTPARQPAAPPAPAAQAPVHHQAPEARPLSPAPPPPRAAPTRSPAPAPAPRAPVPVPRPPAPAQVTPASPAPMPTYAAAQPVSPYPVSPPPAAPPPVAPPPVAPPPVAPLPVAPSPAAPSPASAGVTAPRAASAFPRRGADRGTQSGGNRPVSAPPPPPPGITPIAESRPRPPEQRMPDHGHGEGPNGSMVPMPIPRPPAARDAEHPHPHYGMSYGPPPGSRSDWPTNPPAANSWSPRDAPDPLTASPPRAEPPPPARPVTPPWQADDLRPPEPPEPPEPPVLRLVEPTLPAELREELGYSASDDVSHSPRDPVSYSARESSRDYSRDDLSYSRDAGSYSARDDLGYSARDDLGYPSRDDLGYRSRDDLGYSAQAEQPSLRLVEPPGNGVPRSAPPVSADDDDNLLIFAQTRSAWFSDQDGEGIWGSALDVGWRAAEQAARQPTVGERTDAGLPRRVPRANLVPGSPPAPPDRSLRVVRDPRSIAEHTSGYFNGWRRGQEIGGYPLGGRQQAAGAWDFSRDDERLSG